MKKQSEIDTSLQGNVLFSLCETEHSTSIGDLNVT